MAKIYTVESPARIHLGFMELDNTAPRLFGSAGLAINKFRNKQKIELSKKFEVFCNDQEIKAKIQNIIKLFSQSYKIKKCRLTVIDFIPLHRGLGSGTQIALMFTPHSDRPTAFGVLCSHTRGARSSRSSCEARTRSASCRARRWKRSMGGSTSTRPTS